jgi:hypothetical protein
MSKMPDFHRNLKRHDDAPSSGDERGFTQNEDYGDEVPGIEVDNDTHARLTTATASRVLSKLCRWY